MNCTFAPDSPHVDGVCPAANFEPRRGCAGPSLLILHYTGMDSAEKAIDWLSRAESNVSCHYVVAEDGRITQMVPEHLRAWHAGVSFWRGETDINSHSIGIEIQNPGHEHGYPDFPAPQMRAVARLARCIMGRNAMPADAVLAHSDVAPDRKIDPGEKFDWAFLAAEGVGLYVPPSPVDHSEESLGQGAISARVAQAQRRLAAFGYDAPQTGELCTRTHRILRAFQLHFRPERADGRLDMSTETTLARVLSVKPPAPVIPASSPPIA